MATEASLREVQELGHELASKLTAQLILIDLLIETTEGEATELAMHLANELQKMTELAGRLQAIGRRG
jgi:hypothetical protein